MSNHELQQRIQYLVEHGGIAEDPLTELHQRVRVLTWLVGCALVLNLAQLLARVL